MAYRPKRKRIKTIKFQCRNLIECLCGLLLRQRVLGYNIQSIIPKRNTSINCLYQN